MGKKETKPGEGREEEQAGLTVRREDADSSLGEENAILLAEKVGEKE